MEPKRFKPLIVVAAVFFLVTAYFARPVDGQWNSPDETANAFWANRVAAGAELAVHDVIFGIGRGAVHPRSFAVVGDAIVPGSFPGIFFLYGAARAVFAIPLWMLTPLLTALAGLALARALRPLFGERVAFWSAILFFAHPAVVYYAARGLFHNMLCIDLLIFAAWMLIVRPTSKRPLPWFKRVWLKAEGDKSFDLDATLAGLLFGFAMLTRLSEAVWAVPLFFALAWHVGPKPLRRLAWILAGAALPAFMLLYFNASAYGSPLRTGYVVPQSKNILTVPFVPGTVVPGTQVSDTVSAFGLRPMLALRNAWAYGVRFFWWISVPSIAGALLWAFGRRGRKRDEWMYLAGALLASIWLAAFYGSWPLQDRFDATQVTIGTSYARYFLPAYVLMLPFAASALLAVADRAKSSRRLMFECAIIAAALTVNVAIYAGDEGLQAVRATLASNAEKKQSLVAAIPADAVVLTRRFDKVLFPDRLRIAPVFDAGSFDALAEVGGYAPLYYYGLDADASERDLVEREMRARGYRFASSASPWPGETLYRLTR